MTREVAGFWATRYAEIGLRDLLDGNDAAGFFYLALAMRRARIALGWAALTERVAA